MKQATFSEISCALPYGGLVLYVRIGRLMDYFAHDPIGDMYVGAATLFF